MSRFSHLEFGQKRRAEDDSPSGEAIRDEQFFRRRAEEAWLAGDFEKALQLYSRALEQQATFYEGWFGQVRMLIELGEYQEAILWTDKALELFPEHAELLAAKAIAWASDGDLQKAQAYSDNAVARKDPSSYVWLARARVLLKRKSRIAETCIRTAIGQAGPVVPIMRFEAGRLLMQNRRYAQAMEHLAEAASQLGGAALVWYEYGRCQAHLGLPGAATAFEQCLQLRPKWQEAAKALRRFRKRGILGRLRGFIKRALGH